MTEKLELSAQDEDNAKCKLYHHVDCSHLKGLRISLTPEGQANKGPLSILGLFSTESIRTGMRAVDASPFKTIFVVDPATGQPLYALSRNEEYVAHARKKKKPEPPTTPPPPTETLCCRRCRQNGGTSCSPYPNGDCICWGSTKHANDVGLEDSLGELAL